MAPYGTTIAVTGTGFTPTTTGSISDGGTLAGIVSYVSRDVDDRDDYARFAPLLALRRSACTESTATGNGATRTFTLPVDAAPTVTSVTYPTGSD